MQHTESNQDGHEEKQDEAAVQNDEQEMVGKEERRGILPIRTELCLGPVDVMMVWVLGGPGTLRAWRCLLGCGGGNVLRCGEDNVIGILFC